MDTVMNPSVDRESKYLGTRLRARLQRGDLIQVNFDLIAHSKHTRELYEETLPEGVYTFRGFAPHCPCYANPKKEPCELILHKAESDNDHDITVKCQGNLILVDGKGAETAHCLYYPNDHNEVYCPIAVADSNIVTPEDMAEITDFRRAKYHRMKQIPKRRRIVIRS